MGTRAMSRFEVTGWEETTYDEPAEGPKLARATVRKTFEGDLVGESSVELLMCKGAEPIAYTALERVVGRLGGRTGSFVLQHGAISGEETAAGVVLPDSGTGELRGLRGTVEYRHDERGATCTLDYDIE